MCSCCASNRVSLHCLTHLRKCLPLTVKQCCQLCGRVVWPSQPCSSLTGWTLQTWIYPRKLRSTYESLANTVSYTAPPSSHRSERPSLLLHHLISPSLPLPTGFLTDLVLHCHSHTTPDDNLLHSVRLFEKYLLLPHPLSAVTLSPPPYLLY